MEFASLPSPVGTIGVLADAAGLHRVGWGMRRPADAVVGGDHAQAAVEELRRYFTGEHRRFALGYDLSRLEPATRAVLTALAETVAWGETVTYGELARRSGTGLPPRAVGAVMGSNPVPLVIPCHRVLAADGLGGFSGGDRGRERETKLWLLEHEEALPPTLW
ncbi:methylated-DNA-[protein]-cysteine S-methyltransferase [Friedmanniella endophytica]|uniref:Methylated-DNA--protein-cysteine methyltransferase n=1 Tax=Microlunatus kandeliicorticis TaxID=1759536 RepID=A0A7W3IVJ4_9ACTN|nr:methylated-DNA--[protein]-cysteine S-methyltransferase [Microlunatus kandeliicorticis]MBA8795965.1 methylated-DNA-[protein]-cysteine S-methyltransferase [Microlunatus kandeliicorticis]